MIPWIQVYSNLPTHPKTSKLAEELKLSSAFTSPNIVAAGILVGIWTWAIQNAYDGDLSACSPSIIADACRWKKKPELLISALKKSGYLDADMKLHDWDEYAVLLIDAEDNRREKTRERVKRYRDKKRNGDVTECNGYSNVTDTQCNAPTIPDITIPDITNLFCGGGGDAHADARASEAVENPVDNYCEDYDVAYDRYFAADEVKADVAKLTQQIFSGLTNRQPTKADEAQVFHWTTRCERDETTDTWSRWIDNNARDLLIHAFRLAAESGKAGDWKYITGILRRMGTRGIKTVRDAEMFDIDRDLARDGLL